MRLLAILWTIGFLLAPVARPAEPEIRPRIRDLGVEPGIFAPGPLNAITDVEGVRVGHRTLIRGDPANPGYPYCVAHCGVAYQAQLPRRDRRPPPPLPYGGPRVR